MATLHMFLETNHRVIIFSLASVVLLFVAACTLHDVIPICHYLFGCDHHMHTGA